MFLELVKSNHEKGKLLLVFSYNHFNVVKQFVSKISVLCWLLCSRNCSVWTQVADKVFCIVICKLFCFLFLEYFCFYYFS